MSNVFFNHSLSYILRQGHLMKSYLASLSSSSYPACHRRARLPRGRIISGLPCPPDFYLGAEALNAVPCAGAITEAVTSILVTDPPPRVS